MKKLLALLLVAACGDNIIPYTPDAREPGGRDDWDVEGDVPDTTDPHPYTPDAGVIVDAPTKPEPDAACEDRHEWNGVGRGHAHHGCE